MRTDVEKIKQCRICKRVKPISEFHAAKQGKYGVKSKCKQCFNAKHREKYAAGPDGYIRSMDQSLNRLYGIGIDDYDNMFKAQNGCCAICGIHSSHFEQRLNVDHNHSTGEIRGLLCTSCNNGLGRFKDKITFLKQSIRYLEKYGCEEDVRKEV
jgi:hypothetical protein